MSKVKYNYEADVMVFADLDYAEIHMPLDVLEHNSLRLVLELGEVTVKRESVRKCYLSVVVPLSEQHPIESYMKHFRRVTFRVSYEISNKCSYDTKAVIKWWHDVRLDGKVEPFPGDMYPVEQILAI